MAATVNYKFKAEMTCESCVNAIKRSLTKTFGTELVSVDASVQTQIVDINIAKTGDPYTYDDVYNALAKTGRTISKL